MSRAVQEQLGQSTVELQHGNFPESLGQCKRKAETQALNTPEYLENYK